MISPMPRPVIAALACAALLLPSAASALSQRTFVSTAGDDAGACSLTQPCRTFGAAIAKASAGGEVVVLDSGGYGTASFAKSVSLIAPPGVYAGISVFSGVGIDVTGLTVSVTLRGLTFNGLGGVSAVQSSFATVSIENCVFTGMSGAAVQSISGGSVAISDSSFIDNGGVALLGPGSANLTMNRVRAERTLGIAVEFQGTGQLTIRDSLFTGAGGGFVKFDAYGTAQPKAEILSTTFTGSGGPGFDVNAHDSSTITLNLRDSTVSHTTKGVSVIAVAPAAANVSLVGNLIADNQNEGVLAAGAVTVIATGNALPRNLVGLTNLGATLRSSGNNVTEGSATPVSGPIGSAQSD